MPYQVEPLAKNLLDSVLVGVGTLLYLPVTDRSDFWTWGIDHTD